jgi:hypothetical protein
MWTIKEGQAAVDSVRRELGTIVNNLDEKVSSLEHNRITATDQLRNSMETRISTLENVSSNFQGRIWAIGAVWSIIVLVASIGVRFIGH